MKKPVKITLIILGILVVLIIGAVVAAPYLLGVDNVRAYGEQYASEFLGREVQIAGTGFSWLGPRIRMEGFTIGESDSFGDEPFAQFESFDLKLRLMDLIRLKISVEHIILSRPRIRVVRNAENRWNFDDILERINERSDSTSASLIPYYAAKSPGSDAIKAPPVDLQVDQIIVEDGELFFSDATSSRLAKGIAIQSMNLNLSDLSLDKPIRIRSSVGIGRKEADITFTGTVGPVGRPIIPGNIPFDLELAIKQFDMERAASIAGPLPVAVSGIVNGRETVKGSLTAGIDFSFEGDISDYTVKKNDGHVLIKDLDASVKEAGHLNINRKEVNLKSFRLTAAEAVLEANGIISMRGEAPVVDLRLSTEPVPLSGWDRIMPDLGQMAKLDGDLTFDGTVKGTVGKNLKVNMVFSSERIELDRGPALLARSSAPPAAAPAGVTKLEPVKPLPVTVTGSVSVKQGRFEKIRFTDMNAVLSQKATRFSLDQMRMTAFEGRLTGNAWAELGVVPIEYGTKMKMEKVQVNDALEALANAGGILFGEVSVDVSAKGKGTEFEDLEKHLSGSGSLIGENGRIATANLAAGAGKAASLLGMNTEGEDTKFDAIDASFTIRNGKVQVSRMRIATGEWDLTASGNIGLDQSLELTSRMTLSKVVTSKISEKSRRFFPKAADGRLQIPLKITGSVTSPKYGLDSNAMSKAVKKEVEKKVEKKTDELKKKLGEDIQNKLKGLFK